MFDKASADRRVAVVTGGSGAIGGAIAARLARDHIVVVLDRGGDIVVDLGDPVEVRRAADAVLDRYGRCDVLVHAAAMVAFGPFDEFELEVWRQVQAVNVESALLLTQAFVPGMRDRGFAGVDVELTYVVEDRDTRWIDRLITLHGVDEGQRAKLADVAEKTPVTRVVRAGAEIRTITGAA
jgi:NAD(P)-dependent dehydrogenase (short-subunit alcohol dehydrogenase family)